MDINRAILYTLPMKEITLGHEIREEHIKVLEEMFGMDEEYVVGRVDTKKVHEFAVSRGEFYFDPGSNILFATDAESNPKRLDILIYYVGGEREAELLYFNSMTGLLVFQMESEERFINKLED